MNLRTLTPLSLAAITFVAQAKPLELSGIYPSLTMFNDEGECGTGAVVPWGDSLWIVTYAPHSPKGSSDKLYQISGDLIQTIRPESIGGTPANRMIHRESGQLFIGPYAISDQGKVRTIPYAEMFGRPTGNARHLTRPEGRIMYATMEEGIYEVDVETLKVTELWGDEASKNSPRKADLPGYHGKGFYSGQGVYVYSNNGEHGRAAMRDPDVPSGVLAEWDGKADEWTIVRRNQFTEVTGPGGIYGNANPATDPIWAVGWDSKSLLLGVRLPDEGWSFYRLPKASHSYDGAHGWNTEWPRIREIGEDDFLMTMHGTFWRFPADFGVKSAEGIRPRSNYLKVIGDFCRWNDRIVFGCDDTAKNEFLNKRKAKGEIAAPQSQSNLWFVEPDAIDDLGPAIGRGAVWMKQDLSADEVSDLYLFAGYQQRGLHLHHQSQEDRPITLEFLDANGATLQSKTITLPASGYRFVDLSDGFEGEWIRLKAEQPITEATAAFTYRNEDRRPFSGSNTFRGLGFFAEPLPTGGIVRARDQNKRTLSFAATAPDGSDLGYYELSADLKLQRIDDPAAHAFTKERAKIPAATGILAVDAASAIYTDDDGKRWRLPKGPPAFDDQLSGRHRIVREVATERDLLNAHGTFYELPARNAGGFSKLRPVATHHRKIFDFCSYRGLFIMSGFGLNVPRDNPHVIRSDDGKTALWAGAIDDIWQLGKPRGEGGPWMDTPVKAGVPSDPYLMTGYDRKRLHITSEETATITIEVDLTGDGHWCRYGTRKVTADNDFRYTFSDGFSAYWIRFISDKDTIATAQLDYH